MSSEMPTTTLVLALIAIALLAAVIGLAVTLGIRMHGSGKGNPMMHASAAKKTNGPPKQTWKMSNGNEAIMGATGATNPSLCPYSYPDGSGCLFSCDLSSGDCVRTDYIGHPGPIHIGQ